MTPQQVENIKNQLEAKGKEAYRASNNQLGNSYYDAHDAVEAWEKGGMVGPIPIDLKTLGLSVDLPADETPLAGHEPAATLAAIAPGSQRSAKEEDHRKAVDVSQTEALRQQARAAEQQGDVARASDLWRQLTQVIPDDPEAQRQLRRRAEQMGGETLRRKLTELRSKANSEVISDLDSALRLAREVLTSAELDESTQQIVQDLETKATKTRSDLKLRGGEIETAAGLGKLKQAITDLNQQIALGRYQFEDREGNIVAASDKLREYNEAYAAFCTQKAREYLDRAELSLPAFPRSADKVLKQALDEFDAADPAVRDEVQRRRTEVGELIGRWDRAQELVAQGGHEIDPEKRLALYQEAHSHYDGVEDLDALIDEAKRDAAAAVVSSVKNIHDRSRYLMGQGKLDEAQAEAMKGRERAREVRGASEALDAELDRIDILMKDLADAAQVNRLAGEAKVDIEAMVQKHDYASALQLLETLPDGVRKHRDIKPLEGRITRSRGADAVIRLAQKRFEQGDYDGVLDLLDPERIAGQENSGTVLADPRSESLRTRATARRSYFEGVALLREDPVAARSLLEHAALTEPELKDQVAPHLAAIGDWEGRRADTRKLIDSAERYLQEQPPKWREAFRTFTQAKEIDSPLQEEALDRWLQVGNLWREELLEELRRRPLDGERAGEILAIVRRDVPAGGREVQEEVVDLERRHHLLRARKAAESKHWQDAGASWLAYLSLTENDLEGQQGLRDALRERALADAQRMFMSSKNADKTLGLLEERLQNPQPPADAGRQGNPSERVQRLLESALQSDPLYLAELVRWSCQFNDFTRAEQYLQSLRLVEPEGSQLVQLRTQLIVESHAWDEARKHSAGAAAEGRHAAAVRMLEDVIREYPAALGQEEWRRIRDETQRKAVAALLEQAREKKRTATGLGRIEVISLFSQVIQLVGEGKNAEAEDGIKSVRGELPGLVRSIVDDAQRFKTENRDPDEALREADRLLDKLNDFRAVTQFMGADGERLGREIESAAKKLGNQRDQLRQVSALMREAREALNAPVSDLAVERAQRRLLDAKRVIATASGIGELQEQAKKVAEERTQLKALVSQLKEAMQDDENPDAFQKVIEAVRGLRQLDPYDRYQLQTPQNLDSYDDFANEHFQTLEAYERCARDRQGNYRVYGEWEKKCAPQHQAFESVQDEGEERRRRGSLEEQQEVIERALAVGKRALAVFAEAPKATPASYPAQDIADAVEGWQQEMGVALDALEIDRTLVTDKRAQRDERDSQLRVILNRNPVSTNRNLAERLLSELRGLDPNWTELTRRENQVRTWRESKSSIFGFGRNRSSGQ